jgi:hypothetical protein
VAGTPVIGEKGAPSFPDNGNGIVGLVNKSAIGTTWKAQQDCNHRYQTNRLSDFHLTPTRTVNDITDLFHHM